MKAYQIPIGILVLFALLIVSPVGDVLAQRGGGLRADLTEEQRAAIHEKVEKMRSQDATREEIHAARREMLEGYGIKLPENRGQGRSRKGFWANLTNEQREAIKQNIAELKEQGASQEEIRAARAEMLQGFGIELPVRCGQGHVRRGLRVDLTKEQRAAIREKREEMRSQGATREEIRSVVDELLKGHGINMPEQSGSSEIMSSETASAGLIAYSYPNPFGSEVNISYALNAQSDVRIQICDVTGRLIRSFEMGVQEPGTYSVHWDGTYENGTETTSGVYWYRIEAETQTVSKRMTLLR